MTASPQLELSSVAKAYDGQEAVSDVSLAAHAGESLVLLGPSGCGKSTTLRLIAGLERPDRGQVRLRDRLVAGDGVMVPTERRRIGMVFQNYALWPHMTVLANIGFGLSVRSSRKAVSDWRKRASAALDSVRLGDLGDRYPHQLSGGQQQRVALARALATDPDLLLLDEPLSNLDASLRREMRLEVKTLQRRLAFTMVYVTHDQAEALSLADTIVVMNHGRVEQVGCPVDVYSRPLTRYAATATGEANFARVTVLAVGDQDATVEGLGGGRFVAGIGGRSSGKERVGTTATACVRPADVKITPLVDASLGVSVAVVRERLYLGDEWHYVLTVLGEPATVLSSTTPSSHLFEVGDEVQVSVTARRMTLLHD